MKNCHYCGAPGARKSFCSTLCRQAFWRLKQSLRPRAVGDVGHPLRFAYADPPYPGTARKYYGREANYAGEVDHKKLISSLVHGDYDGWALSTSSAALRYVLPLCPVGVRVCAWVKPIGVSSRTAGLHSTWEVLIVFGGRRRRPGLRDFLIAMPARGGGSLMGRKPIAFCAFLFEALGMLPGDILDDVFPGTGIIGQTWRAINAHS